MPHRQKKPQNPIAIVVSLLSVLRRMGVPMWGAIPIGLLVLLAVVFRPAIEERLGIRFGLPDGPVAEAGTPEAVPPDPRSTIEQGLQGFFTEVRTGVFESPAGLRYRPGSKQGHRMRHVMAHASDQPKRAGPHGVFDAKAPAEVFKLVDEAYLLARAGRDTATRREEGRVKHTVNLRRRIGFVGGQTGNANGRPEARRLRIILEGVNVITAYPVR